MFPVQAGWHQRSPQAGCCRDPAALDFDMSSPVLPLATAAAVDAGGLSFALPCWPCSAVLPRRVARPRWHPELWERPRAEPAAWASLSSAKLLLCPCTACSKAAQCWKCSRISVSQRRPALCELQPQLRELEVQAPQAHPALTAPWCPGCLGCRCPCPTSAPVTCRGVC